MAVNPANPPRPALQATDKNTFAYITAKKRWPEILEKVIDDIYKTINSLGPLEVDKIQEGKRIADSLTELKYQIQQKNPLMYVCLKVYRYFPLIFIIFIYIKHLLFVKAQLKLVKRQISTHTTMF